MTDKLLRFPAHRVGQAGSAGQGATLPSASAEQIAEALGAGTCPTDAAFDQFLPAAVRRVSPQHWTPLAVAARAADWLDECNIRTVVDIGSGSGKFCVAAALAGHCHFTGLEHREHLVTTARSLASTFDVESRVHFVHGALATARLPSVDAYYLYNPFEENLMEASDRIDDEVELSAERYASDLEAVRELLLAARAGTYVLTYNGIGANLPASYQLLRVDRELPNVLRLWRMRAASVVSGRMNASAV